MKKTKSKKSTFSAILVAIGVFLLLGTVGGLETDNIGMTRAIIQSFIGVGIIYLGAINLENGGF